MSDDPFILNEEQWDKIHNEDNDESDVVATNGDGLVGRDSSGSVTVTVTPTNEVVSVQLNSAWKNAIAPHDLGASVITATNSATARLLEKSTEEIEPNSNGSTFPNVADTPPNTDSSADESPITAEDAMRLVNAATRDLEDFMYRALAITDQPITAESSGGHVRASGKPGHVKEIDIDPHWVTSSRDAEIEAELLDVINTIKQRHILGELANGPRSANIAELVGLVSDPDQLLRRVGLTNPATPRQPGE